jgi:hypothetical protein
MRWEVLAVALVAATAGCIGAMDDAGDQGEFAQAPDEDTESGTQQVERVLVFTDEINEPAVALGNPGPSWSANLGPEVVSMDLELTWGEQAHRFGLEVEQPDGDRHVIEEPQDPSTTSNTGEVPDPPAGDYTFHLTSEGPVAPDQVELTATVVLEVPLDGEGLAAGDGAQRSEVRVEETEDGYRATVEYTAEGSLAEEVDATVDTVNGAVALAADGSGDQGMAEVTAWADGDTREEARERVLAIHVSLTVEDDTLDARAEAEDWEHRGASVDASVPQATTVGADLDTTNGAIQAQALTVDGYLADTTNGAITGTLTGQGDLGLDTTNGGIDVAFTPTADSTIQADTTNGGIELALNEDGDTGYEIGASLTNGRISEDMQEARLEGGDDEATLVTDGYGDRSIQVDGQADTMNGNIHFESR